MKRNRYLVEETEAIRPRIVAAVLKVKVGSDWKLFTMKSKSRDAVNHDIFTEVARGTGLQTSYNGILQTCEPHDCVIYYVRK